MDIDVKMPPAPEPAREEIEEVKDILNEEDIEIEEEEEIEEKEIIPDEEVFADAPKISKVKKKCSQKQLDHLAKIRAKALAKKKENQEFRRAQKEKQKRFLEAERKKEKPKPRPKKVVKVPKRRPRTPSPEIIYETESSEEEYYEKPTRKGQQPVIFHNLTASQIRQLQYDAINGYDTLRKQRKEEKRQAQQQQAYHNQVQQPDNDPWAVCFQ